MRRRPRCAEQDPGGLATRSLVLALGVTMIVADVLPVAVRRIRVSAGPMVQVVAMALLGPAPAAAIGIVAAVPDAAVNRVRPVSALMVRRRVEDAGGRFAIETRPDGGTRSRVVVPVRPS